jgi:hypothetical protein
LLWKCGEKVVLAGVVLTGQNLSPNCQPRLLKPLRGCIECIRDADSSLSGSQKILGNFFRCVQQRTYPPISFRVALPGVYRRTARLLQDGQERRRLLPMSLSA